MISFSAGSLQDLWVQLSSSLWNQFLSVAAGLSVVPLLHVGHFSHQLRPDGLVNRHLEGHLFEHFTHRHLQQTRGRWLDWLAKRSYCGANQASHTMTSCDLVTSRKPSFLNMPMLTWFSSPIFAWNFLTPSLVSPVEENTLMTTIHQLLFSKWRLWSEVWRDCNSSPLPYVVQHLLLFHFALTSQ